MLSIEQDWDARNGIQYEFIDYFLDEDKTYVHVPSHQAYYGQGSITDRLINRQKQMKEWMKN